MPSFYEFAVPGALTGCGVKCVDLAGATTEPAGIDTRSVILSLVYDTVPEFIGSLSAALLIAVLARVWRRARKPGRDSQADA